MDRGSGEFRVIKARQQDLHSPEVEIGWFVDPCFSLEIRQGEQLSDSVSVVQRVIFLIVVWIEARERCRLYDTPDSFRLVLTTILILLAGLQPGSTRPFHLDRPETAPIS